MANKLYEENDVWRIANSIRRNAPRLVGERTMLLSEMPSGIDDVYMEGYENGWSSITDNPNESDSITTEVDETSVKVTVAEGYYESNIVKVLTVENGDLDAILDYFVDENTRDATNIHSDISVENQNVRVTVESGYYTEDTIVDIDVSDVAGSGGGIGDVDFAPLIEQANNIQSIIDLNDIDPWISDEFQRRYVFPTDIFGQLGFQFPDIIEYETSDPRSCPITVTFYNYNPHLTAHVAYHISDNAMQEYWYSVVDISPEESVSESFDSDSSRGSDWVMEIIGAYFTYD